MAVDECTRTRPGIDLLSEIIENGPFPIYARLRRDHPVCQIEPHGFWVVSRFDDVRRVLEDWETFASSVADDLYDFDSSDSKPAGQKNDPPRLILSQDPPDHGKYRDLVKKFFLDSANKRLIPLMRDTARSLLDNFNDTTPVDFVEHFAYPYVGAIVKSIVGLDDRQSMAELREWVMLEERVSLKQTDEDFISAFDAALARQNGHFIDTIKERREHPRDDLITELVNAKVDGEKLSDSEICGLLCLIVSAGFMTSVHMLSHAVILLSRNPEVYSELRSTPDAIPGFGKELLRFSPPVLGTIRRTTRAVRIGDVEIPEGETVIPIMASANRDPEAFANPDTFDLNRQRAGRQLSFGYGVHTCLGAALARLELNVVLETLLDANLRFVCPSDDEMTPVQTLFIRGVSKLPVRLS
ncbi:MAG: cytochrome P450 [Pseudomonadota bacterium]